LIIWVEDNIRDADWIKTLSWDLPTNVDAFIRFVGEDGVNDFMHLPAAEAMPESLKNALANKGYSIVQKYAEGQPRDNHGRFASGGSTMSYEEMVAYQKDYGSKIGQINFGNYNQNGYNLPPVDVLHNYIANGYRSMNDRLRNGYPPDKSWTDKPIQDNINDMTKIIDLAPAIPVNNVVYRGMAGSVADKIKGMNVGESWVDKGFVSTSVEDIVAHDFNESEIGNEGILLKIKCPPNTKGIFMESVFSFEGDWNEKEYVLQRGSKFTVTNKSTTKTPNGETMKMIEVEVNQ